MTESQQHPAGFVETPEFQAAVAAAASKAVEDILAKIEAAAAANRVSAPQQDNVGLAEALAMSIAEISDQGTNRKRVAPEVLQQRAKSRDTMMELLIEARATGRVPIYHLRNKVYLDEMLVDPVYMSSDKRQMPTEIHWPGVPSEAMIPVNDIAKEVHAYFVSSIGSLDPKHQIKSEPLFTTAGGLVVQGRPTATRAARGTIVGDGLPGGVEGGEGLTVGHRGAPGHFSAVNVLGTVARPAMQTV